MGRGSWNKQSHVVPGAHKAMDNFKYEIAGQLGLPVKQGSEDYWGNVSSRDCGAVGGHMVRRMIEMAESQIMNSGGTGMTGGTTGGAGMTGGTTGGAGMTGGTTGGTNRNETSYARGTTYNSNNDRTGSTMTTGTTGGSTGTTANETSYARGTTYNSNNDRGK